MNHCTRALEALWPLYYNNNKENNSHKSWRTYQELGGVVSDALHLLLVLVQAAVTDLVVLNNKHLFLTDLKAGKSKIKEQTDVFQMSAFSFPSCILTLQRDRESSCVIHEGSTPMT